MQILIADDDLTSRTILGSLFKKWGYDLLIVNDAQDAWQVLLQPDAPTLLVLDWMMPGMDGVELIQRVRKQFIEQPPYIILITARAMKGDIITVLEAGANDYIKKPFEPEELFARIRVGQRSLELQQSNDESKKLLARLALYDGLTGILNRRGILEQLARELSRAKRAGESGERSNGVSIGFFDLDHFKRINDQYGHQVGDEVLKGVADLVSSRLRSYDFFGRLGGDEFLVIAPDSDREKSKYLFQRLLTSVTETRIKTTAGELPITLSMGVVSVELDMELEEIMDNADKAMYRAKQKGGNQVSYSTS